MATAGVKRTRCAEWIRTQKRNIRDNILRNGHLHVMSRLLEKELDELTVTSWRFCGNSFFRPVGDAIVAEADSVRRQAAVGRLRLRPRRLRRPARPLVNKRFAGWPVQHRLAASGHAVFGTSRPNQSQSQQSASKWQHKPSYLPNNNNYRAFADAHEFNLGLQDLLNHFILNLG